MLVSTAVSQKKVAEIIKTKHLAQSALFVARTPTLLENASINHLDHPVLILPITSKGTGDTRYTL